MRHASLAILAFCAILCPARAGAQPATVETHSLPFAGTFIDGAGNVYNAGASAGQPVTSGAAQTQGGGGTCPGLKAPQPCSDAYIGKADAQGNLVFGTLLGGSSYDYATAMTLDAAGNVFVVGDTGGSFPTTPNAAIAASTTSRVFAAKLGADGSRFLYATYLPDNDWDAAAVALDSQGGAFVAGTTAAGHAFVARLAPDGSNILYNVTLPGTRLEQATAIAVDAAGNATVTGFTAPGAWYTGPQNVFVARLDPSGHLAFYKSIGGTGADTPHTIRTGPAGNIYVAGQTTSLDFPTTPDSFQPAPLVPTWNNGMPGGFIFELTADGTHLVYSTYIMSLDAGAGGVTALAVSASGETYLVGSTGAGFPVTASAPQPCFGGRTDAFLAHLDPRGALLDATYLGGPHDDTIQAIALAVDGSILLAGYPSDSTGLTSFSRVRFGGAGWSAPACLSPDALNAATFRSPGPGVSPGEFVTLTGLGLGPEAGAGWQPDPHGAPPLQLAGVQVLFDGQSAPLLYVQSRQVNVQAPFELQGKTSTSIQVQYRGTTLGPVTVPVVFGNPGIFRLQSGVSAQAAALNQDGTLNGPTNPARPGSVVMLFGTGFGPTDPTCPTGGLNVPGPANLAADSSVRLSYPVAGGSAGSYAEVGYAGSAPTLLCGVTQINMVVPASALPGNFLIFPEAVQSPAPGSTTGYGSPVGFTISVK